MTIDQLETLEMIVEKGSFKAAAEALHKTQPSLSVAIRKLEEEYSLLLFNRQEYRPKLTPEGKIFYNWAKQTLTSFRELQAVGEELGTKKVEPFLTIVLDPLARFEAIECIFLETVLSQHPTEVTFRTEIMSGGLEMLLSGDADFAVSPKMSEDQRIESVPFDKVEMVPVIAKSLVKVGKLNAASLKLIPQIIVEQQYKAGKRESRGVLQESRKCFVTDHGLKHKMILNGFGWGRLAKSEIDSEIKKNNLVVIQDDKIKPFILDMHVMRAKQKAMGPVGRAVWAQLTKQAPKRPN